MAKKRGKLKLKGISKKQKEKISHEPKLLHDDIQKLVLLYEEKKVEQRVKDVQDEEESIEKKEGEIATEEKKLEKETEKIENIEKKIAKDVETKPLTRFNFKDLNKGIIGAFIGVVAHFGFIYGKAIANSITVPRATLLLVFSYLLILILMYETGYREVKEKRLLGFLPKRATIIYFTSIVVVIIIFLLFGLVDLNAPNFIDLYKSVAVTSVLATLGAGTADLLGKH